MKQVIVTTQLETVLIENVHSDRYYAYEIHGAPMYLVRLSTNEFCFTVVGRSSLFTLESQGTMKECITKVAKDHTVFEFKYCMSFLNWVAEVVQGKTTGSLK